MLLHRSERMKSNYCCYATGVIRAWRMQLQTNLTTDLLLLTGLLQAYLAEYLKICSFIKTGSYKLCQCFRKKLLTH